MNKKCNDDNLYVKPIEYCSSNALIIISSNNPNNNLYNINNNRIFKDELLNNLLDFNNNFRENQINNNYVFNYDGIGSRNKNLCEKTNKISEYYLNCVLQTSNPLFTYKDGFCIVSPDIILPPELKKLENKNDVYIKLDRTYLEDEEGNFKYEKIQNNKYCEDRWFDWIVIPNYHLGNRVLKDSGIYSKEDVKVCYNNCGYGELPYINSKGNKLCIPKEIAYNGIYENKLDYSPLALINLIGNNKYNINLLYKNMYFYKLIKKTNTNKYNINTDVNLSENLSDSNNYIINEVFDKIKKVLNIIVNDNNLDIPDYSLDYKNITYKHPYFKENDLISILGMDKNEILSNDIILIHTAYLAYNYYDFTSNLKYNDKYLNTSLTDTTLNINKYDNYLFNINENLNKLDINSLKTGDNNLDNINTKKKRQRLANILYKAINICYDKKTDFSKNIIKRTNEAFNRYNDKIIKDLRDKQSSIVFTDADIDIYKSLITNNKNNIDNGFEIEYYKNNYLKDFYDKIGNKEFYLSLTQENKDEFKNSFQDKFIFYTEEYSEIINGNICKSGQFVNSNNCVNCNEVCNTPENCTNNINCKIFCGKDCIDNTNIDNKTKCGGTTDDYTKPLKEKRKEIKTPIEEETNIPDFSYIFKTTIKIFFIFIVIYIAYMFYKIFNESILTFGNLLYGSLDWFYYNIIIRDKIKIAEHYENIIQDKYNTIIRKTMT